MVGIDRKRYLRQILFTHIGEEGQKKLSNSYVVIVGCGALGSIIATSLVRAGIGRVRILDRDFIEYQNLQRQFLFDEDDVKGHLPKAIAAERHLKKINSTIYIEGIVSDVNYSNVEQLVGGADIILDGLDNLETRFLINDVSLKLKIPWIYGGVGPAFGMTMNIIPGQTPCLRCIYPDVSEGSRMHDCNTAGLINSAPFITGSLQSSEALKILVGSDAINRDMIYIDVWRSKLGHFKIIRRDDCLACHGRYEFLEPRAI